MRADRLPGLERVPLRLVEPPQRDVAPRRGRAGSRRAEPRSLRAFSVRIASSKRLSARARSPSRRRAGRSAGHARLRRPIPELGEELRADVNAASDSASSPRQFSSIRPRRVGDRPTDDAAALLRELLDALDQRLGLGEVEPVDVALRERHRDLELQVLPFGRPRRFERELRPVLERLVVGEPCGHQRSRPGRPRSGSRAPRRPGPRRPVRRARGRPADRRRGRTTSASAVSARPSSCRSPAASARGRDLLHLDETAGRSVSRQAARAAR